MPKMKLPPTLYYRAEWDRMVLRDNNPPTDSLNRPHYVDEMVIHCAYHGEGDTNNWRDWYTFSFVRTRDDGDWIELITRDQFDQRFGDIDEHDGPEVADIWAQEQNRYEVVRDTCPAFDLRARFEAMMELGLFSLPVSHRGWHGRNLSEATREKMEAARVAWRNANEVPL